MITLNCTHCRATLEMDDAFAGGACRCQHCGTIQTVPKNLKPGESAVGQAVPGRTTTKAAYQTARHGGTGLDELGDLVTGSGLSRGGSGVFGTMSGSNVVPQDSRSVSYATPQKKQKKKNTLLMIILGGVAAAIIIGIVAYFGLSTSTPTVVGGGGGGGNRIPKGTGPIDVEPTDTAGPEIPKGPNILGVDLTKAASVVYVIDRGSSISDGLDNVKAATFRSIRSLGPKKKFAVLFWDRETDTPEAISYPESGLADATEKSVGELEAIADGVVAGGQTAPLTALQRAAKLNPTDVVVITAKGDDLHEDVVAIVNDSFHASARVHSIAVYDDGGTVLKQIADKTGGSYRLVKSDTLRRFAGAH